MPTLAADAHAPEDAIAKYQERYTDEFATVNGVRLHYTDWNPEGGRPILLVHGLSANCHTWDPIAYALCEQRRVICLDLRGHGQSGWAESGYHVSSFASDIAGLVDQLGLAPFDYVGHSLGAQVGITYAGAYPDGLEHLLMNDLGPEMPPSGAMATRQSIARPDVKGFRDEAEAREYFRQVNPGWQEVFYHLHARYQTRRNWAGKLVFCADPELFWLMGSAGRGEVPYMWEMAGKVVAPALLIRCVESNTMSPEIVDRMRAVMPSLTVATVSASHHFPREQPERFVQIVWRFLSDGPSYNGGSGSD